MLMNVDAARRELGGVSRTTLWRCIRAGDLEVVRIGRRVLVPEQALRAFIKASTQRA
ncbi:MAG: helix-turn-helix domain-containing protein, partial [Candidatus Rokubacteria bacterium]|nr:helix-turn-helix domain-containing protein [Candidatus Rokubacteria bacterium]